MVFNSYSFFIFFPVVVLITFIVPKKVQYIWLLIASYYFYMNWDAKYTLLLLLSTVITYISGLLIEQRKMSPKLVVGLSFTLNLSILFFFKYFDFAIKSANLLLGRWGMTIPNPKLNLLLPVGISFYIFQALSYTMDVYRGEIKAERNILKYALFVSFFPQLVAGPIERSKNLLKQVNTPHSFSYTNMRDGLLTMLWGYFQKLIIADRVAIFVDEVYSNVHGYQGAYLFVASVLFAFQIYCDFSGYSTIAIGAAKVLGFDLMENFNSPYLAVNIKDFWRRWHISLSTWFRDYLYIPLGGSRVSVLKKYRNLIIVFMVSGLWHGAAGTFVVWGLLHGIFQIIGDIVAPIKEKMYQLLHVRQDFAICKLIRMIITFVLVDMAWIFFRADTVTDAIYIIRNIVPTNLLKVFMNHSIYDLGLNHKNFMLAEFGIVILMLVDYTKYRGIYVKSVITKQNIVLRWIIYYGMIAFILIFGIWGEMYDASSFIYFQF